MEFNGRISIIIPVFNEEKNIRPLYDQLLEQLKDLAADYEIIFIDDGSSDQTVIEISTLTQKDPKVSSLVFSRNFGHQIALFAGLEYASGNIVITMDGDLQHPPSLIPKLIESYLKGHDIVNTKRIDHKSIGIFKKLSSNLFYRILNFLSEIPIEPAAADFRLMSHDAVSEFRKLRENNRFNRGLVSWMGFRQSTIEYQAEARNEGVSKFSIAKMLRFGVDGITSFSAKPLRIVGMTGMIIFFFGLIYGIIALFNYFTGNTIAGWTSILISILLIGGFQILALGIIGEYIARIFIETKNRSSYIVKEIIGEAKKQ